MLTADLVNLIGRLVAAAGLGAAIGLEREWRQKEAGLRTNTLIALGSALFTVMSIELSRDGGDPGRVAAQIVTGIGFLGGGAILHTKGSVSGLTTAATIWVNAAIGVAAGAGYLTIAATATAVTLVVLTVLNPVDIWLERRRLEAPRTPHDDAKD